jgi:hypothetical protein
MTVASHLATTWLFIHWSKAGMDVSVSVTCRDECHTDVVLMVKA